MNRGRSRSPIRRDRDDRRRPDAGVTVKFNPNSDRMVYVTNLSYETDWKELKDIIREHAEVSFVEVLKNRDGKSKGVAVVELATKEGANKTIDVLHRKVVGGRTLSAKEIRDPAAFFRKIKDDTGVDFLDHGNDRRVAPSRDRRHPSPGLGYTGETYGLSTNFLDSLKVKLPLVNRVFVTNIPFTCSVGKLFDVFSLAGRITWLDLQLDADGKSRGMAVVEYSHPLEAVQAISMLHDQRLIDRTLTVKMDRFEKDPDRDRYGLPIGLRTVGTGLGANGAPLKDIASVVGQIQQQPAVSLLSNNGINPLIQPQPQTYSSVNQPPVQSLSSIFEQPSAVPAYNQPVQPIRQASPPPSTAGYFQNTGYASEQSSYAKPQSSYVKQEYAMSRSSYGETQPRQSISGYSSGLDHQAPTRTILIQNLPEDYTWNVIAQRIRQFGDFESVKLVGPGIAKAHFLTIQAAERATNTLNNTLVESNRIKVEYIV